MDISVPEEGIPDFVGRRDHVLEAVVGFVRALRQTGVEVPADAAIVATRALVEVGFDDRDRARAALRAALVSRSSDLERFDRLFPAFWYRLNAAPDDDSLGAEDSDADFSPLPQDHRDKPDPPEGPGGDDGDGDAREEGGQDAAEAGLDTDDLVEQLVATVESDGQADDDGDGTETAVYSPTGSPEPVSIDPVVLGREDDLTASLERLTDAIAGLRGRRWDRSGQTRADVRRALRESFNTGGTVVSVPRRDRKRSAVRARLLVDVSQSMLDVLDRGFLVRFLREAYAEWRDVRVFFFDTNVREVSSAFDAPSSRAVARALARAEAEWGGGTRIGNAIDTIRTRYPDAIDRSTVTFIISDGLEVGEIDRLESGMIWLSRRSETILWLNPLAGSLEYEPSCRGIETALPYVDGLFPFTGPEDIDEIAYQIEQRGLHGSIGYQYDRRRVGAR